MKLHHLASAILLTMSSTVVMAEAIAEIKAAPATQQVTPPAITVEGLPKQPRFFDQLDINKDGKVSPQEAQISPALVKGFKKIDANNDGFLSPGELSQLQVQLQVEREEITRAKTFIVMASLHTL